MCGSILHTIWRKKIDANYFLYKVPCVIMTTKYVWNKRHKILSDVVGTSETDLNISEIIDLCTHGWSLFKHVSVTISRYMINTNQQYNVQVNDYTVALVQ